MNTSGSGPALRVLAGWTGAGASGISSQSRSFNCRTSAPSGSLLAGASGRSWIWRGLMAAIVIATTGVCAQAGPATGSRPSPTAYYEAAVRGDPEAQAKLAETQAKTSVKQAFQWSWRAAQQGHAGAQLQLSEMFASGQGVPKHLVTAYVWAHLAQANATDSATTERADRMIVQLAEQMSNADIREALRRAADWKPQPETRPSSNATTTIDANGRIRTATAP